MKKRLFPCLFCALICISYHTSAQVTIGSGHQPVKGALLDLKDDLPDSKNATSKTGGLILPRVTLDGENNKVNLQPFIALDSPEWSDTQREKTKKDHVGLMVYNVYTSPSGSVENETFKDGLYIWDGSQWSSIASINDSWLTSGNTIKNTDYLGTNNDEDLIIKTNSEERIRIKNDGETRIVHELTLGSVPSALGSDNMAQLVRDNQTGKVHQVISTTGNTKSLNYIRYVLKNVERDWVSNFDTKIDTENYTLIVVGASFDTNRGNASNSLKNNEVITGYGTYNPQEVYAFMSTTGTWRLRADYRGGSTAFNTNGTWTIYCIAISNTIVRNLPAQEFDLGGAREGSAPSKPAGL